MRLLLVNSAWPQSWGGGEKWFVEAAEWFKRRRHDVRLVGRPDSRLVKTARERGVNAIETPFGGDLDPFAILRARSILAEFGPDVVLTNFNKESFHFALAAGNKGPTVVARHGFPLWKNHALHRWLARRLLAGVIINAAAIWDEYRGLGLQPKYVAVVPNGVSVVDQKAGELRRRFGVPTAARLILAAGRLESQKRFDRLIEIVASLVPERPDLICLIAGEGLLKNDLESRIRACLVENHIRLIGFLPAFASLCGDADLFLLTSEQEGMPNALLEAMAAGVACVSFDVGSVPQIFTGDLRDFCVPRNETDTFTQRVAALLDDRDRRSHAASVMLMRVVSDFSFEASMRRYEEILEMRQRS